MLCRGCDTTTRQDLTLVLSRYLFQICPIPWPNALSLSSLSLLFLSLLALVDTLLLCLEGCVANAIKRRGVEPSGTNELRLRQRRHQPLHVRPA